MRNYKFITLLISGIVISTYISQAQQTNEALLYMNEVMLPLEQTKNDIWQYLKAVTRGKGARKVESKRQKLLTELKTSKYEVKKKGSFNSDPTFKDAVVKYLDMSYIVLKEDFDKILDMEDIAEQSYDLMEAYLLAKEKANDKLSLAYDSVVIAQEDFAKTYGITLLDAENDKTSEKIERASQMLTYYNEVYLLFFKSYKQEVYVLDAMQRNDVNSFEQNISTLGIYSSESLEKLKAIKSYRGDASLKVALQKVLRFYQREAEVDFSTITDYYLKKDNFERIQKTLEAKSKRDRTQEDVNKYNNAANEYNNAANALNKVNETLNNERTRNYNEWNSRVERFFDMHSK